MANIETIPGPGPQEGEIPAEREPEVPRSAAEIARERFEDWQQTSSLPMRFEKAKAQLQRAGRFLSRLGIQVAFAPQETVAETRVRVSETTAAAARGVGERLNQAWQSAVEKKNSIVKGFQERVEGIKSRRQERLLAATQKIEEQKLREELMDQVVRSAEQRVVEREQEAAFQATQKEYETTEASITSTWEQIGQVEKRIAANEAWLNLIKARRTELLQHYIAAGGLPETASGKETEITRERAEKIISEGEQAIKRGAAFTQNSEIHRLALDMFQNCEETRRALREIESEQERKRQLSELVANNRQRLIDLAKIIEQKSGELSALELERRQAEAA